ncbi:glycosyltransferase family 1 protein [Calothrix sp. UHCC 0171]|uniref:glycosyltransferase n=1 Tax=Calothrix sp. UHCC 0171 TaxID=3110245 RepID=UPI002B21A684|nr:glycosyltransferase family 1 protein [Calothrix sp. UHCC 0171]MEA5573571.1 glycosyltransferase family 1 protein [Calothrix sp. UHCC 0171]
MEYSQNEKVFFYVCPTGPPEDANYQHLIVCLAEGFKKIGIEFYASNNYWKLSHSEEIYLLKYEPKVSFQDCTIVVIDQHWYRKYGIPKELLSPNRNFTTVFLDSEDWFGASWSQEFRQFDVILRTHYNNKLANPKNVYPWGFGLSERILRETNSPLAFKQRKNGFQVNFRHHSILGMHSVRKFVNTKILPLVDLIMPLERGIDPQYSPPLDTYQYLMWHQSGCRHYPSYYERLQKIRACGAFGGFFYPPLFKRPNKLAYIFLRKFFAKSRLKSDIIIQWDSWRFWESLAAGCATFHVDFQKYGCQLPVMPQNWVHYIGFDLDNIQATLDRLIEEPEILEKVASSGREWAINNFGTESTAKRFLQVIDQARRATTE